MSYFGISSHLLIIKITNTCIANKGVFYLSFPFFSRYLVMKILKKIAIIAFFLIPLNGFSLEEVWEKAEIFKNPVREYSIIATNEGYYPRHITSFEGEDVKLYLTTTLQNPSCLILPDKEVYLTANIGKITEAKFRTQKAGDYEFYCPNGKITGKLTVLKKIPKENLYKKTSVKKKKIENWMPKEFHEEDKE